MFLHHWTIIHSEETKIALPPLALSEKCSMLQKIVQGKE